MGFLARIVNRVKGVTATDGGHAIDKNQALNPTDAQAITPHNPGNWSSIRTAPIADRPQYFDKATADAMWELRKQTTQRAKESERVYKHLGKIEQNDSKVHVAHKKYLGKVSDAEFSKVRGNAKLARHLHSLRSQYAQLGVSVERAEVNADDRVQQFQQKLKELRGDG